VIELTEQEREELTRWSTSRTLAAGDVFKAKLILALSDGVSYSRIEVELKTSGPTIARWKARFEEGRIAGLEGRHKGSRPRAATPAMQARVLKKTQQKPPDGSTHWSCRKMAAATGLSPATVHRIWSKTRLKPHRLDRYMASNDPAFEQKAADIIGLYLDPPQHAAVFCVRKNCHSGIGSPRSSAAPVSGTGRAPWIRVLPARHSISDMRRSM
jgi:hypothetical protein